MSRYRATRRLLGLSPGDLVIPGVLSTVTTTLRLAVLLLLMPLVNVVLNNGLGRLGRIPGLEQFVESSPLASDLHWVLIAAILSLTALQSWLGTRAQIAARLAGQKAHRSVLAMLYGRLISLQPKALALESENVARRLHSLPSRVQRIPQMARMSIDGLASLAMFSAALLVLSWPVALASTVILAALFFGFAKLNERIDLLELRADDADDASTASLHALATNRTHIVLSGTVQPERELLLEQTASRHAARLDLRRLQARVDTVRESTGILALLGLVAALPFLEGGASEVGRLLVVVLVLRRLVSSFNQVLRIPGRLRTIDKILEHVEKNQPSASHSVQTSSWAPGSWNGALRLRSVSYSYERSKDAQDRPALVEIDLDLEPGLTFLLGANGSGKSTLLRLVARILQPSEGQILVGERDLATIEPAAWHAALAYAPTRPRFFTSSLRQNVAYGIERSDHELDEAAHELELLDWIEHRPGGWDAILEDLGSDLSTGEQQRLALLRAFVREPRLLLLDEALSALDAPFLEHTMAVLRRRLTAGAAETTVLLATHQLDLIQPEDRVVILTPGREARTGTRASFGSEQALLEVLAPSEGLARAGAET